MKSAAVSCAGPDDAGYYPSSPFQSSGDMSSDASILPADIPDPGITDGGWTAIRELPSSMTDGSLIACHKIRPDDGALDHGLKNTLSAPSCLTRSDIPEFSQSPGPRMTIDPAPLTPDLLMSLMRYGADR